MASPSSASDELADLRIADLLAFLAVQRTSSITAAARELCVTPSQVSKAIARLEVHTRGKVLARTARGVTLTEVGMRIAPHVEEALHRLRSVRQHAQEETAPATLIVGAPSWVLPIALPAIAAGAAPISLVGYELAPAQIRAFIGENLFDMAIAPSGAEPLPPSWTSDQVGFLRMVLLGPPDVAERLAPWPVPVERLRDVPFVAPTYQPHGRFVAVRDGCPLAESDRKVAHQAQTVGLALELAVATGSVVFGPRVAARRFLERGLLVDIPVQGWDITEPLFVHCNDARVLARVRNAAVLAVRKAIEGDAKP